MEVDVTKLSYIRMFRQYSANIHETRKQDYRTWVAVMNKPARLAIKATAHQTVYRFFPCPHKNVNRREGFKVVYYCDNFYF